MKEEFKENSRGIEEKFIDNSRSVKSTEDSFRKLQKYGDGIIGILRDTVNKLIENSDKYIKGKLTENSRNKEEKYIHGVLSTIIEEKLMESTCMKQKLMERTEDIEEILMKASRSMEDKLMDIFRNSEECFRNNGNRRSGIYRKTQPTKRQLELPLCRH
ncbi:hypothetical protein Trydic_g1961 [Trypoxylus dichotomus]